MTIFKYLWILIFVFITCSAAPAQQSQSFDRKFCNQNAKYKRQLISIAEKDNYLVYRIVINGNIIIRDQEFRDRMVMKEGDTFTEKNLATNIKNLNEMNSIKPMTIKDLGLQLDRKNRDLNLFFCVEERRKN